MKHINSIPIKYLSLGFVLSYILIHNIYVVIAGIALSLYELNKKSINSIKIYLVDSKKNNQNLKTNNIKNSSEIIRNKNEKILKLVEEVEELGFIPSKDINKNAA